jgi:hypothetical protein
VSKKKIALIVLLGALAIAASAAVQQAASASGAGHSVFVPTGAPSPVP